MQTVLGAASNLASTTAGAATTAASAATNAASAAASAANNAVAKVPMSEDAKKLAADNAAWVTQQAQQAASQGVDFAQHQKDRMEQSVGEFRTFVELWMKRKMHQKIELVVDSIPGIVKDASDDPEMPGVVKRGKDRVIDKVWPDIKEEVMWQVAVSMDAAADEEQEGAKGPGPDCIRAYLRYHIFPCDKTIWGTIKDPIWIIFTLAALIPWAGITPLIFLFIFVLIDKTDTFQLLNFILQFKGTLFISHGVIRCVVGYFLYLSCATAPARVDEHSCEETGPGMSGPYEVVLGGWMLQILLLWTAFFLLPCSKEKGRKVLRGALDDEIAQKHKKGGYIRNLLVYDVFVFLVCIGIFAYVVSTRPDLAYDDWVSKHVFYTVQVTYGLSSFPFFFFTLPGLQAVLTHSIPTKYDNMGRACAVVGPPKPKPEKQDSWADFLSVEEAQKMMWEMQAVAMGRLTGKAAADAMAAEDGKEAKANR